MRRALITGITGQDHKREKLAKRETYQGVKIRRLFSTQLCRDVLSGRLLNGITFAGSAALRLLCGRDPGVVVAITTPPFLPWVAWLASLFRNHKYVVLVHDLYPDVAVKLGYMKQSGLIHRAWRALNQRAFSRASAVIVLGANELVSLCFGIRTGHTRGNGFMSLFATSDIRDANANLTLKIAINALSARIGGGVTYLNRLIHYLREVGDQNEYYIFVTQDNHAKIVAFEDPRFHVIEVHIRSLLHRLLYEQFALPILLKQLNIDIIYAPAEIAPLLAPCAVVLGIQNPNVYYRIEIKRPFTEKVRFWILRQLAKLSSRKASRIIFVSNTARTDIEKILKANPAKTRAIYHGVELNRFQKGKLAENLTFVNQAIGFDKYILCLSTLARHKNIETLIKAYAALDERLKGQYRLVIAGRKVLPYYDELTALLEKLDPDGRIVFTGEVPHENVVAFYHRASLFVLPSYLETFGIPLIEAMASGVPVIASNAPAIPEVVGDAGLLFDPNDPDELRAKMEEVLSDQDLREKLITKGLERARTFSWEKCAIETLAVFKEAHAARRSRS